MLIPGGCGGLRTSIRDRDSKMGGYFWLRYIKTPGSGTSFLFNFVLVASRFCWFPPKRLNSSMSTCYLKAIYHWFCRVTTHYCSIIYFVSIVCYAYLKALFANTNRGRCKRGNRTWKNEENEENEEENEEEDKIEDKDGEEDNKGWTERQNNIRLD